MSVDPSGDRDDLGPLTPALIDQLKNQGLNQSDIAALFGVTRQAVSKAKHQVTGFSRTPREVIMDHFPWKSIGKPFNQSVYHKCLRLHAEFVATGGAGMSDDDVKKLRWFYRRLKNENAVVEFDPSIKPYEGNRSGGFVLRPRLRSDGDLLIRVNAHAVMTERAYDIWRFPTQLPNVNGDR